MLSGQEQLDPQADRPERQTQHFQRFVIGSQNFSKCLNFFYINNHILCNNCFYFSSMNQQFN